MDLGRCETSGILLRLLAALCAALAAGCSHTEPPAATVLEAHEVGTVAQSSRIVGRDGAYSAQVFGHEVFTFGDTFLSLENFEGTSFVSNTFATGPTAVDGGFALEDRLDDAGAPDQLLLPTDDEEAYYLAHRSHSDGGCDEQPCGGRYATWPAATVFDADAGVALTFYGLLTAAPGDFNFQGIGQGIAMWNSFDSLPSRPSPGVCPESPTTLFCADEPGFGAAAVLSGDLLYSFACPRDGLSFHCILAQVPFSAALDKTSWRYWDGEAFSNSLSNATPLFDASSILFVFFNAYVGRWMVIYAQTFSNQVVMRTAAQLTGPWSAEGNLFTADRGDGGGDTYDALVHPELSEEDGKILYVTFSRSTGEFSSELALVRVELQ